MPLVFIIDDSQAFTEITSYFLQAEGGFDVVVGGPITKALEKLRSVKPDVITTDWLHGSYTGAEIADRVRQIHPDVPIVLISGIELTKLIPAARQMGASSFLQKPCKSHELCAVIKNAICYGQHVQRMLKDNPTDIIMVGDRFGVLRLAAHAGDIGLVKRLIDDGVELDKYNRFVGIFPALTWHPAMIAAKEGHDDLVALLLANLPVQVADRAFTKQLVACAQNRDKILRVILKLRAEANPEATSDKLLTAIKDANLSRAVAILEAAPELMDEAELADATHNCVSPLWCALSLCWSAPHLAIVEYLLKMGANPNSISSSGEPLLIRFCHDWCMTTAAEVGIARFKGQLDQGGVIPVPLTELDKFERQFRAISSIHGQALELLIKNGVDVNCVDDKGCTPLHYAALNGSVDLATILIRAGARRSVGNKEGAIPLDIALRQLQGGSKHPSTVRVGNIFNPEGMVALLSQ
jgi:ankyrin repeat protein/CheY-like chemotaxis protein